MKKIFLIILLALFVLIPMNTLFAEETEKAGEPAAASPATEPQGSVETEKAGEPAAASPAIEPQGSAEMEKGGEPIPMETPIAAGIEEGGEPVYAFPTIEPQASVSGGYRSVNVSGSKRSEEFEYLHDSITYGAQLRWLPFPHRIHLDLDVKNKNDYFGDFSYAYKDLVLFRGLQRALFHNLDNVTLFPLGSSVDVTDQGKEYGVTVRISNAFLRFKMPDYPFHLYSNASLVIKDGDAQQRFVGGSGFFGASGPRRSESRDIDWTTQIYTIGVNSHINIIEADLSHTEKRFDPNDDEVLYFAYSASGGRPAGTYPHNRAPETKGSINTLKLHTTYTGALVASATFSENKRENELTNGIGGAKADYLLGEGDMTWMPWTRLTFFLKYRHIERDFDNPDSVTIVDRNNPVNSYTSSNIKNSMSSITDTASLTGRYRPFSGLTLRASYTFQDHRRSNADEWGLPDETKRQTVFLSGDVRIKKSMSLKLDYTHKETDDPAYNIEPDQSDEGKASLSWKPAAQLNALVSYSIGQDKRKDVHYGTTTLDNRDADRDTFFSSIALLPLKDLSFTLSYAYMHNRVKQDLNFGTDNANGVPYEEYAHNVACNLLYLFNDKLDLNGGISYTRSRGKFYPTAPFLEPAQSLSELELREAVYSVGGHYEFWHGFGFGVDYRYSDFDDVIDTPYDGIEDGTSHIVWATLSKRWG